MAPQRWGKSLNLSMTKIFLSPTPEDLEMYKNGKYNFDKPNKNADLFKNLKIGMESSAKDFDYDRFEKDSS